MLEEVSSAEVVSPDAVVSRVANFGVCCLVPDRYEYQKLSLCRTEYTHDVYGMCWGHTGAESRRPGHALQRAYTTRGGTPAKRWRSPSWSLRWSAGRSTCRRWFTDTRPRNVSSLFVVHLTSCSYAIVQLSLEGVLSCVVTWYIHGAVGHRTSVRARWRGARTTLGGDEDIAEIFRNMSFNLRGDIPRPVHLFIITPLDDLETQDMSETILWQAILEREITIIILI